MMGPDLLGLTVAVLNVVGQCFLEQLGFWLLNHGIKRKFEQFLCLTISDILNWIGVGQFCALGQMVEPFNLWSTKQPAE